MENVIIVALLVAVAVLVIWLRQIIAYLRDLEFKLDALAADSQEQNKEILEITNSQYTDMLTEIRTLQNDLGTMRIEAMEEKADELLPKVIALLRDEGRIGPSRIQRELEVGYERAVSILDLLKNKELIVADGEYWVAAPNATLPEVD